MSTRTNSIRAPRVPARIGRLVVLLVAAILGLGARTAVAQARNWPSEGAPKPLPAKDVSFPAYELKTLPNGMQLVVVQHGEEPAVSLRLLVRAGSAQDPAGKAGVASLVAALLDQGTSTRSAEAIADTIDFVGGTLDTGAGRDLSYAQVVVLKDSLDLALELLADVVRNPAFAPVEIERQRQQLVSALKVSYQDPEYLANVLFDRLAYGFNPYGFPSNGTPDSVARITRDDLLTFHRRYFAPNNCILALVGDIAPAEAYAGAEKAFGDWARHDIPTEQVIDPPEPTRRVVVLDKADAVQTEVRIGHLGIPRKHRDYMALDLAIKILGGEGANRLHRVLRTERGLTYGASADMETLKRSGELMAETNTRSEATAEVLRLMVDEFARLRREPVREQELADAKAYMTGNFPLTIETPDQIATRVLNVLFYDLPVDDLQTFRQRVNAVTVDDVARVAREYLKPDRLSVVLVGNAAAFVDQLKGIGFSRVERVPLADLDLAAADFRRPGAGKPADGSQSPGQAMLPSPAIAGAGRRAAYRSGAGRATQATGQEANPRPAGKSDPEAVQLVDRVISVKGGLEKLQGIKTVVATAKTTFFGPAGSMSAETKTYIEYPGKFRVEARVPVGEVVQVFADGKGWVKDPNGVQEMPPAALESFQADEKRDLVRLLLAVKSGSVEARMAPAAADHQGVKGITLSGPDMDPVTLWVDSAGEIARESFQAPAPPGQQGGGQTVEESYSDFRNVNGLQVAYMAVRRIGQTTVAERTFTDFKYNVPIDPGLFERPK